MAIISDTVSTYYVCFISNNFENKPKPLRFFYDERNDVPTT